MLRTRRTARGVVITSCGFLVVSVLTTTHAECGNPQFCRRRQCRTGVRHRSPPSAQASLVTRQGKTILTQTADSLGGLLFQNVSPGKGYRVLLTSDGAESAPLTVHADAAAPWDPSIYNQTISDNGYQYLTTRRRDQARHRRAPADGSRRRARATLRRPLPNGRTDYLLRTHVDRILGLRVRRSGGTGERNRHPGEPHGALRS